MTLSNLPAPVETFNALSEPYPTPESLFGKTFYDLTLEEIHLLALAELAWDEVFNVAPSDIEPQN